MEIYRKWKIETEHMEVPDLFQKVLSGAFFDYQEIDDTEVKLCFFKEVYSMDDLQRENVEESSSAQNENGKIYFSWSLDSSEFDETHFARLKSLSEKCSKWSAVRTEELFDNAAEELQITIELYFETLIEAMNRAILSYRQAPSEFQTNCKILEGLLFINCIRVRQDNVFLVSDKHPVLLMQKYAGWLSDNAVSEATDMDKNEKEIIREIISTKNKNRKQFRLFSENQIFEVSEKNQGNFSVYWAGAFEGKEGNTEIPAVRLWEKVTNYVKRTKFQGDIVRVAAFGKVQEEKILEELCKLDKIEVEITCFRRIHGRGRYYFRSVDSSSEKAENVRNEEYDLLYSPDLEKLFASYSIILLLDMNCFYKQHQNKKDIREKNELINCRWYMDRASGFMEFKDKVACYQLIYDAVGEWFNSYNTDMSAKYDFDEQLYLSILNNVSDSTDVYLYIKYGNKIAGESLHNSNICNDEYYDGKQLIVYKYAHDGQTENDEMYMDFSRKGKDYVRVDFWKILKSINNSYYKTFIAKYENTVESDIRPEDIRKIKKTYCILNYSQLLRRNNEITYCIQISDDALDDNAKNMLKDLMEIVLKYAFESNHIFCVHNYFKNLLVQSIISNANNISNLIFAFLLSREELGDIRFFEEEKECKGNSEAKPCFAVRKTVYSIIENLSELRLRSMDDREGYFMNDLRKEICPKVSADCFKEILKGIHMHCEEFDYTGSRLYVNSDLNNL